MADEDTTNDRLATVCDPPDQENRNHLKTIMDISLPEKLSKTAIIIEKGLDRREHERVITTRHLSIN